MGLRSVISQNPVLLVVTVENMRPSSAQREDYMLKV